jgi:hypothetical protein
LRCTARVVEFNNSDGVRDRKVKNILHPYLLGAVVIHY